MAMPELLPTPHDYRFDEACHVDFDTLHPFTLDSLYLTNQLYASNRGAYIASVYSAVHRTEEGLPYAHYHKPGDSKTDAWLILNPFGTPIAPRHEAAEMIENVVDRTLTKTPDNVQPNDANKLLQGQFLYETAELAGITDIEGRTVSGIVVSSPSLDHKSPLNKDERKAVARGDFGPFAIRALDIVRSLGYGRIYAAGYSMGSIAGSAVRLAGTRSIDVLAGCYIGDAPNFKKRRPRNPLPLGILYPYMFDSIGSKYKGDWISDGPDPRTDIARNGEGYDAIGHWFRNGNFKVNISIGKGLSRDGLTDTLDYMHRHDIPTTLSWSESKLMRGFEDYLNDSVPAQLLAANGILKTFRAVDAPHISGENQVFLTDVMLRSLLFANGRNY
jgi:hypothetical protein